MGLSDFHALHTAPMVVVSAGFAVPLPAALPPQLPGANLLLCCVVCRWFSHGPNAGGISCSEGEGMEGFGRTANMPPGVSVCWGAGRARVRAGGGAPIANPYTSASMAVTQTCSVCMLGAVYFACDCNGIHHDSASHAIQQAR